MDRGERRQLAGRLALERAWLDENRVDALLKLGERWKIDLPAAGFEAGWLTHEQAQELALACGSSSGLPPARPPQPAATTVPGIGSHIGGYVLQRHLGSGAMGSVFVGHLTGVNALHAVKLVGLTKGGGTAATCWGRFEREAQSLSRLDHPGVVRVHSFGVVEGGEFGYLSMDLIDGETLESLLESNSLSLDRSLEIVAHLARALAHVHGQEIMHRDVKPANVVIRADTGRPVLCDFGLVRGKQDVSLTKSQQLLGTPRFMAPELVTGERSQQGPPTDVFALGVLLYFMLTQEYPFEARDLTSLASQILTRTPPAPSSLSPGPHRALDGVVLATLEKAPEDRPSAEQVAQAVEQSLRGELRPLRGKLPTVVAAGVVMALLVAAVASWGVTQREPGPTQRRAAVDPIQPVETPSIDVVRIAIAAGDGRLALAAVHSALALASSAERAELEAQRARARILLGDFDVPREGLGREDVRCLQLERERRSVEERLRVELGAPMAWRELVDLGSTLASKARRVGVATDLERVVRTRASETLLRIALGAPSGGFSPRNLVDRCFGDLDSLGVVDPRVPIARGLVYAGLSHDGDSVSFEPVLAQFPDPMDVPQPWRHAVRTLKRYKTMRTRADRVAISESALVPPVAHPFAQSPPSTSERVYHYLWRSRVAAVAVERFLEILGRGTIDRNAYELAVSHTRSALSFSRTGNSDDQRNFQLVGLGELHLCAGRYALAESTLADVTALKDRDIGLRDLVLAECALEQGDLDAAGRLLDTVSLQTLEGDVVSLRARLEFASGRVERADELVSRLGAMNGTFAPWRSVQNTIRILAGDDPRAPLRVR